MGRFDPPFIHSFRRLPICFPCLHTSKEKLLSRGTPTKLSSHEISYDKQTDNDSTAPLGHSIRKRDLHNVRRRLRLNLRRCPRAKPTKPREQHDHDPEQNGDEYTRLGGFGDEDKRKHAMKSEEPAPLCGVHFNAPFREAAPFGTSRCSTNYAKQQIDFGNWLTTSF